MHRWLIIIAVGLTPYPNKLNAQDRSAIKKECTNLYIAPIDLPKTVYGVPLNGSLEGCIETISSKPRVLLRARISASLRHVNKTIDAMRASFNDKQKDSCRSGQNSYIYFESATIKQQKLPLETDRIQVRVNGYAYKCSIPIPSYFTISLPIFFLYKDSTISLGLGDPTVSPRRETVFIDFVIRRIIRSIYEEAVSSINEFNRKGLQLVAKKNFEAFRPDLTALRYSMWNNILRVEIDGSAQIPVSMVTEVLRKALQEFVFENEITSSTQREK